MREKKEESRREIVAEKDKGKLQTHPVSIITYNAQHKTIDITEIL